MQSIHISLVTTQNNLFKDQLSIVNSTLVHNGRCAAPSDPRRSLVLNISGTFTFGFFSSSCRARLTAAADVSG